VALSVLIGLGFKFRLYLFLKEFVQRRGQWSYPHAYRHLFQYDAKHVPSVAPSGLAVFPQKRLEYAFSHTTQNPHCCEDLLGHTVSYRVALPLREVWLFEQCHLLSKRGQMHLHFLIRNV